jgi:hypothetical protein
MREMKKLICLLFSLTGFIITPVFGQNDTLNVTYEVKDTLNKNIRLFDRDDLLEFSLRFNITAYKRQRSEKEYLPAVLTYHISETDSINKDLKIRARGIMRLSYCDYPPIRLNFKKSESPDDEFSNIDKLKLVTHCKLGNEEYTLQEYLIYKLYNVLTDLSYRVRLARINYINTAKQSKPVKQFAFLIEPTEVLCKRTNSVEVLVGSIGQKTIKPDIMDRMAIFNYMIGNCDWDVVARHNVVILSQGQSERPDLGVIIPYDFDYSGLISTSYAVPPEVLPIESVRERYYLGICRNEKEFINALKEFSDKKEELYKVITEFPYLKDKIKKQMTNYLDGFFNDIDKRNTLANKMMSECFEF